MENFKERRERGRKGGRTGGLFLLRRGVVDRGKSIGITMAHGLQSGRVAELATA